MGLFHVPCRRAWIPACLALATLHTSFDHNAFAADDDPRPGSGFDSTAAVPAEGIQVPATPASEAEPPVSPLFHMSPVVVTASRGPEKVLRAPASISVVDSRAIEDRLVTTPASHVRSIAGVDVASKGINQTSVVARGFSSAQSTALLALTDYRYTSIPSLRYNLFHYLPTPDEDMDRIEVLRGPAAALYGPNCDRGVLHILTRSPWSESGTSASFTGGSQGVSQLSIRQAGLLGSAWGYKISGQYFRGDDWEFTDPVEAANRDTAIAQGALPDTLRIGRRDFENEHGGGEASLEWRPASDASVVASAGYHRAVTGIEQAAIGAVQVGDWGSSYVQLRGSKGKLFAQGYLNASSAGETYLLRSGDPVVDRSRFWAAQLQHGTEIGARARVTYGVDGQWTIPRTDSSIMGRNEERDEVREIGAYVHSALRVSSEVDGVLALRVDDHSRFGEPVISPRAALVVSPREGQSLRLTYNRAFGTPASDDLFADLVYDSLTPLPYAIRVEGVPETGFSFARDAGGAPLMRSPFPSSVGGPGTFLPIDGTLLWETVVALAAGQGVDLSGIPAPTSSEVFSEMRLLQNDETFQTVSDVSDVEALEPTVTNALEVGYRAQLFGKVNLAAEVYHTWVENFIGHLRVITPNVFLESTTLAAYLEQQGMSQGAADSLARTLSEIPLGTVAPREALDPADLILAVRNFGTVSYWGSDLSVSVAISGRLTVGGTFSWVSQDLFRKVDGLEDLALNAPARKGSLEAAYRNDTAGWWAACRVRSVASFPVLSGVYAGTVGSYTLADVRFGIRIASAPKMSLTVTAENVFDDRHQEFVGSPEVGRLLLARLGVGL